MSTLEEAHAKSLRKVKMFAKGTGCDFPENPCAYCSAWLDGYNGRERPTISDAEIHAAWRKGRASRPRKGVS